MSAGSKLAWGPPQTVATAGYCCFSQRVISRALAMGVPVMTLIPASSVSGVIRAANSRRQVVGQSRTSTRSMAKSALIGSMAA